MPAFPNTLPELSVASFQEQIGDGVIRSVMDVGPAKVRRRSSAVVHGLTGDLAGLTDSQVSTLMTFYTTTLSGGVLAFDLTHPRTGATVQARFVSPPTIRPLTPRASPTPRFTATLSLEVLP